ncbi:hypothetical protein EUTSA_v10002292mg [Eutrema salsugineum]|uniref:Non-specific lipid-transfer protein n=1 Tax=Eutrema salsugineum TaxID=72664 RepID=V4M2F4_EUTSA|nr:non-specific lipid-transfer protein 9 [Eutrema salsugineum]ESQ50349.1 hypothetical protein EUTSA_v10002292mg [Eutrema salsugineum]
MRKSDLIACVVTITILTSPFNVMMVHSLTPCGEATNALKPCLAYLLFPGVKPTPECCKGLDTVNRGVKTYEDRRDMCMCLTIEASIFSTDPSKFATLPQLCGVTLFAPIGPKFDCNT